MIKPTSPCLDCSHRYDGCHSICIKYKKFKKALDEWNDMVRKQKQLDAEQETIGRNRSERARKYMERSKGK